MNLILNVARTWFHKMWWCTEKSLRSNGHLYHLRCWWRFLTSYHFSNSLIIRSLVCVDVNSREGSGSTVPTGDWFIWDYKRHISHSWYIYFHFLFEYQISYWWLSKEYWVIISNQKFYRKVFLQYPRSFLRRSYLDRSEITQSHITLRIFADHGRYYCRPEQVGLREQQKCWVLLTSDSTLQFDGWFVFCSKYHVLQYFI